MGNSGVGARRNTPLRTWLLLGRHPAHLIILAALLFLAFTAVGGVLVAGLLTADAATLALLSACPATQRWQKRQEALAQRRRMVEQLDAEYRYELSQLEQAAAHVRYLGTSTAAAQLEPLLTTYLHLACACSGRRKLLGLVPPPDGGDRIGPRTSGRLMRLKASRAQVAALHRQLADRAADGMRELEQQLALTADAIRLIYQHAIALGCTADAAALADEVRQLTTDVRQTTRLQTLAQAEIDALLTPFGRRA